MDYIKGVSYPAEDTDVISREDFRYVHVLHIGSDGNVHGGELIVNKKIAEDITDIFIKLYEAGYRIEKIKLIDEYNGDDDLSVQDNNTSSFNFRFVAGSKHLSKHSLGMAIDINPLYNPYIVNGKVAEWGAPYTDRTKDFPYKMTKDDLCVKLFKQHGFKWGGDCWKNTLDYQHFEKD
ncbi:MAG: M15 family metallopeptidase [Lachnospiraceae bacterium]|nr:M15 family metallopeptidase [Lachnospiraceae bacterium]